MPVSQSVRSVSATVTALMLSMTATAKSPTAAPAIEIEIRNTPEPTDDYLTWAPTKARIRQVPTGSAADLQVVLTNDPQGPVPAGRKLPLDGDVAFDLHVKTGQAASQPTLLLVLPKDGSWVNFIVAGSFPRASSRDKDAIIEVHMGDAGGAIVHRHALMMRIRKDHRFLTPHERQRFLEALDNLHRVQVEPNGWSRYMYFVNMHNAAAIGYLYKDPSVKEYNIRYFWFDLAHKAPGFIAWHRAFLLQFERELQKKYPDVTLPYWIITKDAKVFEEDFMGVNPERPGAVAVQPKFSPSNPLYDWSVKYIPSKTPEPLQRYPGVKRPLAIFVKDELLLTLEPYSTYPKSPGPSRPPAFIDQLEENPHNRGHNWIGPWMENCRTSPSDPVFWVFHANFDRLWARWQYEHNHLSPDGAGGSSYYPLGKFVDPDGPSHPCSDPYAASECIPIGHRLEDTMWPWNGKVGQGPTPKSSWPQRELAEPFLRPFPASTIPNLWPGSTPATPTPGNMIDYAGINPGLLDMGFAYDDTPYGVKPSNKVVVAGTNEENLATFLDHTKPTAARVSAAEALRHAPIPDDDRSALRGVLTARDQDEGVRIEALRILSHRRDPRLVADAIRLVKDPPVAAESALDAEAIEMLNTEMMFAPLDEEQRHMIHSAIEGALKDERPLVRSTALRKLTAMSDPEAVRVLVEAIREPNAKLFTPLQAIQGLMAAHRATDYADQIRSYLKDKDQVVRAEAVSALAGDPRSRETILQFLGDREEPYEVRSASLGVLTRGGAGAARSALRLAIDPTEDPRLRAEAVAVLGILARSAGSKLSGSEATEIAKALRTLGREDVDRIGPVVERTLADVEAFLKR